MSASLERGLNAFHAVMDSPMAAFFAACTDCGICADACLFYTETGDPRYTPIHKLEPLRRFWEQEYTLMGRLALWLGFTKPVTATELATWSELVYDSCTLCSRCSMACPSGIDLTFMIRKMREGMALAGCAPDSLIHAAQRAVTQGSPMGVQLATLLAQIRHQEQACGLPIPMDVKGAEYMVLLSSMEIVQFPEVLGAMAKIFHHVGATWTMSSEAFEATNSGIQLGVSAIARQILERIVVAAEKLQVKTVVSPECGHAYTALRWEGPNLMGKPYSFQVLHILEVLAKFQQEKRLKLRQQDRDERPLSYHDPCQIARRGGILDEPRALLRQVANDFREMTDHREHNWCCGGGGGVSAIERSEPLRARVFKRKLHQLEELGVHTLVTACANCRIIIEEGLETYQTRVEVVGLTELIAEHLDRAAPPTNREEIR